MQPEKPPRAAKMLPTAKRNWKLMMKEVDGGYQLGLQANCSDRHCSVLSLCRVLAGTKAAHFGLEGRHARKV